MSEPWLDIFAYGFVYAPFLACVVLCLVKISELMTGKAPRTGPTETDWQLNYFMNEAERLMAEHLMAERRRVQHQRDALARPKAVWPPKRSAPQRRGPYA